MLVIFVGIQGVFYGDHDLMKLFSFADTDFRHLASGQHSLCQISDLEGRNLGDEGLTAFGFFQCFDHQFHALLQADPETGHAVIGDGKLLTAVFNNVMEERNNGSAASCYVAVTDDGEADILASGIGVGSNEQLIGYQLGTAIQIDRIDGLIRRQGYDLLDTVSSAASMTFCAPWILVLMASAGLYSQAGTCFKAAA